MNTFINIDINAWQGAWPKGHELVIHERGGDPDDGYVLYGFDEIDDFRGDFKRPAFSFVEVAS